MDLTQLKTLMHVAELGSLSKAADRLRIAQPALSRQIRLLERELGVYLFERHGRGMVITDAGREVLVRAARIMGELASIRSAVTGERSGFRGVVSIGTTPTVAEIVTVPLVERIRKDQPELSLRLQSAFTGHLLDWLQRGEIDLAVSYDPQPMPLLRTVPVMMENLMFVAAADRGLRLNKNIRFAALAREKLVLPSGRHALRLIADKCAQQAGIRLNITVEADSFGAMVNLVRSGLCTTLLPLAAIYALVERGELCAAPLIEPTPERKVVLVYPADRPVAPATRYLGRVFEEIADDLLRRGIWTGRRLTGALPAV